LLGAERRQRRIAPVQPWPVEPWPVVLGPRDDVEAAALSSFEENYPELELAPVTVVIAALDEEEAIGSVLDSLPDQVLGLDVSVLVVDDGSSDRTAEVADRRGALVCRIEHNRGQGSALRLGYALCVRHGASYVVTLDADGQYYPDEMAGLLEPLVADEADFVQGSRRLGARTRSDDLVRLAGVHFFGWLVSALTRVRITDSSNGFRAMRAEVPLGLRFEQRQYQTSEVLIRAIARGYRVVERPASMRPRSAGATKKGPNVLFGLRYASVVLGTWLQEH
jgi:glycosyltransferase involved in cell wall biosynthesis